MDQENVCCFCGEAWEPRVMRQFKAYAGRWVFTACGCSPDVFERYLRNQPGGYYYGGHVKQDWGGHNISPAERTEAQAVAVALGTQTKLGL